MRKWSGILLVCIPFYLFATPIRIVSYNVENLFDTTHDSLKNDYAYLPEGEHHWTYSRFADKITHIAQVLVDIGQWNTIPLIGLVEVENDYCIQALLRQLHGKPYRSIHYESPDERGVDVVLLYDSLRVQIAQSEALAVHLPNGDFTRDVLYARALVDKTTDLHVLVCHLPSALSKDGKNKRRIAKGVIQDRIDQILTTDKEAKIVVMGDMNTEPKDDLQGMKNGMMRIEKNGKGTYNWKGIWSCLDQFYISQALIDKSAVHIYKEPFLLEDDVRFLGDKPARTFKGFRYNKKGYSDHLPIILDINL